MEIGITYRGRAMCGPLTTRRVRVGTHTATAIGCRLPAPTMHGCREPRGGICPTGAEYGTSMTGLAGAGLQARAAAADGGWGGGYYGGLHIGSRPVGYRPPVRPRPRPPVGTPGQGGGRRGPLPMIAVNRPVNAGSGMFTRDRNAPVTIGGHTVEPVHPVSGRPGNDRPAPVFAGGRGPSAPVQQMRDGGRPGYISSQSLRNPEMGNPDLRNQDLRNSGAGGLGFGSSNSRVGNFGAGNTGARPGMPSNGFAGHPGMAAPSQPRPGYGNVPRMTAQPAYRPTAPPPAFHPAPPPAAGGGAPRGGGGGPAPLEKAETEGATSTSEVAPFLCRTIYFAGSSSRMVCKLRQRAARDSMGSASARA